MADVWDMLFCVLYKIVVDSSNISFVFLREEDMMVLKIVRVIVCFGMLFWKKVRYLFR